MLDKYSSLGQRQRWVRPKGKKLSGNSSATKKRYKLSQLRSFSAVADCLFRFHPETGKNNKKHPEDPEDPV